MSVTSDDLNAFHRFAAAHIAAGNAQSLQELVDIWEIDHSAPGVRAENVAAIQAAISDMENGDIGRDAKIISGELRAELASRSHP